MSVSGRVTIVKCTTNLIWTISHFLWVHVDQHSAGQSSNNNHYVVSGFNPFGKYLSNWIISAGRGAKKSLEPPPRSFQVHSSSSSNGSSTVRKLHYGSQVVILTIPWNFFQQHPWSWTSGFGVRSVPKWCWNNSWQQSWELWVFVQSVWVIINLELNNKNMFSHRKKSNNLFPNGGSKWWFTMVQSKKKSPKK